MCKFRTKHNTCVWYKHRTCSPSVLYHQIWFLEREIELRLGINFSEMKSKNWNVFDISITKILINGFAKRQEIPWLPFWWKVEFRTKRITQHGVTNCLQFPTKSNNAVIDMSLITSSCMLTLCIFSFFFTVNNPSSSSPKSIGCYECNQRRVTSVLKMC